MFSTLYAARPFVQNELVRDAFNAPGTEYIPYALSITYVINIPFALFALELLGKSRKRTVAIWVWLCSAFAVIAIPVSLLAHEMHWINMANGVLWSAERSCCSRICSS